MPGICIAGEGPCVDQRPGVENVTEAKDVRMIASLFRMIISVARSIDLHNWEDGLKTSPDSGA